MAEQYSDLYVEEDKVLGGIEYGVAAKALHGQLRPINKHVLAVGQDSILAIPGLNIYGVFDGAGGADDVGRPELASQTAAMAAQEYFLEQEYSDSGQDKFNQEYEIMRGAMSYVRKSVEENTDAGLTTVSMFRIFESGSGATTLTYAGAGDSALYLYPDPTLEKVYKDLLIIAGEQKSSFYYGSPSNIVGRLPLRLKDLESYGRDEIGFAGFDNQRERYLVLGTDGVIGDFMNGTEIQGYHMEYALDIEPRIRAALGKTSVMGLLQEVASQNNINLENFDWEQWKEFVEPVVSNIYVTEHPPMSQVSSALVQPRIAWQFERDTHPDDKSLVIVKVPSLDDSLVKS